MINEQQLTQNSKSVQIILKVPESFLNRFDKTMMDLGYSRTEAIREAMRRFQQEGEKRVMERPDVVFENLAKLQAQQSTRLFEEIKKIREDKQKQIIWIPPGKPEQQEKIDKQ